MTAITPTQMRRAQTVSSIKNSGLVGAGWYPRRFPVLTLALILMVSPALAESGASQHAPGVPVELAYTQAPDAPAGEGQSAGEGVVPEWWSVHGQSTFVTQYHPRFTSPFRGQNSLDPGNRGNETFDATLFLGVRIWDGLEFYANPEVDQGFGLS